MVSPWIIAEYDFDILVCRHADYDPDNQELTPDGEQQMDILADSVAYLLRERRALMAHSPAIRVRNSKKRLITRLGEWIESEKVNCLFTPGQPDIPAILTYIDTKKAKLLEILALMTHAEVAMPLIGHLASNWKAHPIAKGQAIYIPKGGWNPVIYPQ